MARVARGVAPLFDIPLPMRLGGGQSSDETFAYSEEAFHLDALIRDVMDSWKRLGDPYFSVSSGDPFEYRSVPGVRRRSVPVALHFRGRATALPFDEE